MDKFLIKYRVIITPLALILGLILLSVVGTRIGWQRIETLRTNLSQAQKKENELNQKAMILQEVQSEALNLAESSLAALPEENPALFIMAQLKSKAQAQGVTLGNFTISGGIEGEKASSKVEVGFDVDGQLNQVINFLNLITTLAPISSVESVEINQSAGLTRASVTIFSYWAPLPQKLPEITEPVAELSNEEIELLSQVLGLEAPAFSVASPTTPAIRTNPFSF